METPYLLINYYGPINHLYRLLQDLLHLLRTTIYYIVWQILKSKLVKAKKSKAKELTLHLQIILIIILNLKSLNMDITIL